MNLIEFQKTMADKVAVINEQVGELRSLNAERLNWRQTPEKWSILECIEHMNRYNKYYLGAIEQSVVTVTANNETVIGTWIGRKSIEMMKPTNKKKQKTFGRMDPANSDISPDVFERFLADQQRLTDVISRLPQINYNAKAVKIEFFKLLKMTIAEAIEFVLVHEERHVLQMFDAKIESARKTNISTLAI